MAKITALWLKNVTMQQHSVKSAATLHLPWPVTYSFYIRMYAQRSRKMRSPILRPFKTLHTSYFCCNQHINEKWKNYHAKFLAIGITFIDNTIAIPFSGPTSCREWSLIGCWNARNIINCSSQSLSRYWSSELLRACWKGWESLSLRHSLPLLFITPSRSICVT